MKTAHYIGPILRATRPICSSKRRDPKRKNGKLVSRCYEAYRSYRPHRGQQEENLAYLGFGTLPGRATRNFHRWRAYGHVDAKSMRSIAHMHDALAYPVGFWRILNSVADCNSMAIHAVFEMCIAGISPSGCRTRAGYQSTSWNRGVSFTTGTSPPIVLQKKNYGPRQRILPICNKYTPAAL
jgi:hypothetical protein